jgi:hypothetical protein
LRKSLDLFSDGRGRCPRDLLGENDYSRMHSRSVYVEVLARVLADYRGETVVFNESLREALLTSSRVNARPHT